MALAERINDPAPISGLPCSIGALLAKLPKTEAAALNTMLTGTPTRRWSQTEIYTAITAEGYDVGRQSVNRHRAGQCRCFRAS